jgi:PilZ domain
MRDPYAWRDPRRCAPRVDVDALCCDGSGRPALVVDLSPEGLKVERPRWLPVRGRVQLEVEMPEVDDVVWLTGEVCFDRVRGGVQSTGLRVVAAAARDLRRIRDFVMERRRRLVERAQIDLVLASCYALG